MADTMPSFYWYDLETFGLDRRRDRPAQFAGHRTTMTLDPMPGCEGEILYARPAQDYLPSPESVLLTGITPQECMEKGMPEHDFARAVWERFNRPGTVSVGYNTLGFDNEVCRFLFWRNFQDPYSHQWQHDCGIWDLYPVIVAYWALRGEGLVWPEWKDVEKRPGDEDRSGVCFRLEELAKANGIEHEHAHDALSDVEATIGLARRLKERAPKFWQWAFQNRTKGKVMEALGKGPVVWVKTIFGLERGYTAVVMQLDANPSNPNEVWVWDLMHDPSELLTLTPEEWKRRLFARRDALLEGETRLPIYRLTVNSCPFVCADLRVLSKDRAELYGIDLDRCRANAAKLAEIKDKLGGAVTAQAERPVAWDEEKIDVDTALYQKGFRATPSDKTRKTRVAALPAAQLGPLSTSFDDADLNELYFRCRGRSAPETFAPDELESWKRCCRDALQKGAGGARTITDFFNEIDTLQETCFEDEDKMEKLEALYAWGQELGENFSS